MTATRPRHVYALFDNRDEAASAFEEVQRRGCRTEHCSVLLLRDLLDEEELTLGETAAKEGGTKGAIVAGATSALVAGLLAIPGGLLGFGPLVAGLFGAGWGATFGGLVGSISGASDPGKALRAIEDQVKAGKILLAVETDDPALQQICDEVFTAHGGERVLER